MKHIIILIFTNTTLLFSQRVYNDTKLDEYRYPSEGRIGFDWIETIYFKKGDNFSGELISIKLNQKLDPMTGFTSEVVFKPNDKLKVSPKLTGGTMNDGQYYIFDVKDIRKIEIEIALRRRFDFYLHYFLGVPRTFFRFVELYSDEVQKDYSGREEIDVIIENEMKKIYQIEKNSIEFNKKLNTVLGGFCIFVLVLYSALGA